MLFSVSFTATLYAVFLSANSNICNSKFTIFLERIPQFIAILGLLCANSLYASLFFGPYILPITRSTCTAFWFGSLWCLAGLHFTRLFKFILFVFTINQGTWKWRKKNILSAWEKYVCYSVFHRFDWNNCAITKIFYVLCLKKITTLQWYHVFSLTLSIRKRIAHFYFPLTQ